MNQEDKGDDIQIDYQRNDQQQLIINNNQPNMTQKFLDLKNKISDFRDSVGIKSIVSTAVMTASFICTGYAAIYKNSGLGWTGYGFFVGSILVNLNQNFSSQSYKSKLSSMIDDIEHSL